MALEGRGHFFHESAKEKHEGTQRSLKYKASGAASCALFRTCGSCPKKSGGKTQDAMELPFTSEEELEPGLDGSAGPGLCPPGRAGVLEEQVKHTEKMATT